MSKLTFSFSFIFLEIGANALAVSKGITSGSRMLLISSDAARMDTAVARVCLCCSIML